MPPPGGQHDGGLGLRELTEMRTIPSQTGLRMIARLLRRPSALNVDIKARVTGGPFRPGDPVEIELSLFSEEPVLIRHASLDLVCTESFWYTVKSTGAAWVGRQPGHAEEQHRGQPYTAAGRPGRYHTSKELVRLSKPILANQQLSPNGPVQRTARFLIPESTPASVVGKIAGIEWQIRVVMAYAGTTEERALGRLIVLPSPGVAGNFDESVTPRVSTQAAFEQCVLSLSLPNGSILAGDELPGTLTAEVHRNHSVSKVRVVLECREQAGAKESRAIYDVAVLQGRGWLLSGQVYEWPFHLRVPDRILPSTEFDETSVAWRVRGVLSRFLRPDLIVSKPVRILTTQGIPYNP